MPAVRQANDTRPRCAHCGQIRREYKQRAFPTRDRVLQLLADGPATVNTLATALGIKPNSMGCFLREYEAQGLVERAGLEPFQATHTFRRTVSNRQHSAVMTHYRTLWRLKPQPGAANETQARQ